MKKTNIIPSALAINLSPEGLVAGSEKIEYTDQHASHDSEVLSNRRQSIWGSED